MYKTYFKRIIDFTVAFIGLAIVSPILIIVTLLLCIDFKGTPFFMQERPGKNEKVFKILKFKTMNDKKDKAGKLLPDSERLTSLGKFIRKTSLDEIPQLINVLKGDMSLIGPRPLRTYYLPFYTERERLRHSVRPGITGLAQVSGRNYLTWEERFSYDVDYVENLSLSTDLDILIKTVRKVVSGKDVAEDPNAIMESFDNHRKKQIKNGFVVN